MSEELAGTADAALHFVEHQQDVVGVGEFAKLAQVGEIGGAHAALALHRFDENACRLRPDRRLRGFDVLERHAIEPGGFRSEAVLALGLVARRHGGEGAAVEGGGHHHDPVALRAALVELVAPRDLDRALVGFRTRVAEEHGIGEGRLGQALGELLLPLDAIEVRGMPELARLGLQRLDQMRMAVPERADRDPGGEVEESSSVRRVQPGAFAPLEHDIKPRIGRHHGRDHLRLLQKNRAYRANMRPARVAAANTSGGGVRPPPENPDGRSADSAIRSKRKELFKGSGRCAVKFFQAGHGVRP